MNGLDIIHSVCQRGKPIRHIVSNRPTRVLYTMSSHRLNKDQVERYSRQLLVPEIGVQGQQGICEGSVLVVGAGGLGCPAAIYLAGAGVGRIGIVDYDVIEYSNLHRQIGHTEEAVRGRQGKAQSLANTLTALNSSILITPYECKFDGKGALEITLQYDVVIDASDNAVTRYLINDVCCKAGRPLISGAALRFDGQLTTYLLNGPCYRCIFPTPPPPAAITNCDAGGVLGPVTGVIGSMQAMEALRILAGLGPNYSGRLFTFDGMTGDTRILKLRPKRAGCLCSKDRDDINFIDYQQFCGSSATDKTPAVSLLTEEHRMTPKEYAGMQKDNHVLLDVRPKLQFDICSLPNALNITVSELTESKLAELGCKKDTPIVCICRRGNQSQVAAQKLLGLGYRSVKDIKGGMRGWSLEVDDSIPIY